MSIEDAIEACRDLVIISSFLLAIAIGAGLFTGSI